MFQEWVEEFEKNKLKEEMSEADKMFEELDYIKVFENDEEIHYLRKNKIFSNEMIKFDLINRTVEPFYPDDREDFESDSMPLNMKELQAINKKVEELKWTR